MENFKEKYKVCGCIPSIKDDRDYPLDKLIAKAPRLPKYYMTDVNQPILDQGEVGACVGFSIAMSRGIQEKIQHGYDEFKQFAPMYIYGNRYSERTENGKPLEVDSEGSGLYPRSALKIARDYGICPKEYANYLVEYPECCEKYLDKYIELDQYAYPYRISSYYRLNTRADMMTAVYTLKVALICVPVYESLYFPDKTGYVKPDCSGELFGYHCMTLIGYDLDKHAWIVQNSWNDSYGDNGVVYLDMDYPISESWAMTDEITDKLIKETYRE